MEYVSVLLSIAAVQLLAAASPGPTFMIVSSHAIAGSRRLGFMVIGGVLLAELAWGVMAAIGLGVVIARFPVVHATLQLAGAAYLIWIGVNMLVGAIRKRPDARPAGHADPMSAWPAIRAGFFTNMANPKSLAYYSSIFIVMIPSHPPPALLAAAVGTATLISAMWWITVALFFSMKPIRRVYERAQRSLDAIMGGVLVCLGARLALSR